jgi:hypothetical protein
LYSSRGSLRFHPRVPCRKAAASNRLLGRNHSFSFHFTWSDGAQNARVRLIHPPHLGVRFLYSVDLFAPHPPILLGKKSQDLVRENAVQ